MKTELPEVPKPVVQKDQSELREESFYTALRDGQTALCEWFEEDKRKKEERGEVPEEGLSESTAEISLGASYDSEGGSRGPERREEEDEKPNKRFQALADKLIEALLSPGEISAKHKYDLNLEMKNLFDDLDKNLEDIVETIIGERYLRNVWSPSSSFLLPLSPFFLLSSFFLLPSSSGIPLIP
jgi:hypothetical protein